MPAIKQFKLQTKIECCSILIVFISTILISILISNVALNATRPIAESDGPICMTKDCVFAAGEILQSINANVDPCDDFYEFACGNFMKNNIIPDDASSINSIKTRAWTKIQLDFRKEFEKAISDDESAKLLKTVYRLCMMNAANKLNANLNHLKTIFKSLGGWPVVESRRWNEKHFGWTKILLKLFDNGNYNLFFFQLIIRPNLQNKSQLVQLELDLPTTRLDNDDDDELVQQKTHFLALHKYYTEIATLFGASAKNANSEMEQVIDLQRKIFQLVSSAEIKSNSFVNLTIEELQANVSSIEWLELINGYFRPVVETSKRTVIRVRSMEYLKSVHKLLEESRKRVLGNYIFLTIILNYIEHLPQPFRQAQQNYIKTEMGQTRLPPRWSECITELKQYLPDLLTLFYSQRYFDRNLLIKAEEMVANIKRTFIHNLVNLEWMDRSTMRRAAMKANQIKVEMNLLLNETNVIKFYKDLELNPEACYLNVLLNITKFSHVKTIKYNYYHHYGIKDIVNSYEIRAAYNERTNQIILSPALLQHTIATRRPSYLHYGTLGFIIAHEILHAFDRNDGQHNDENGNSAIWAHPLANQTYFSQAQCFMRQYQAERMLKETIADNGAVDLSYKSYLHWLKENEAIEQKLAGLFYTPRQLFWIAMATMSCSKSTKEREQMPKNRVLNKLKNSHFFAEDFGCGVVRRMNIVEKCKIW